MDRDYINLHSNEYPMVCFDPSVNNYIPYGIFQSTPDIKFFQTFNYTNNYPNTHNYRRKKVNTGQNIYQNQEQIAQNSHTNGQKYV